eukprot:3174679-Rhodomonas_salina.1
MRSPGECCFSLMNARHMALIVLFVALGLAGRSASAGHVPPLFLFVQTDGVNLSVRVGVHGMDCVIEARSVGWSC